MRVAKNIKVLVKGGGDLASGAIIRLARAGFGILVLELPQPLAVRRLVSFAQGVFDKAVRVEDIQARLAESEDEVWKILAKGEVALKIDPSGASMDWFRPDVILDARMLKKELPDQRTGDCVIIGLGPGFQAGKNCSAVIETQRGPFLGRVIWDGSAAEDTGTPDWIGSVRTERVIRAPVEGVFQSVVHIGDHLGPGELIGSIGTESVTAQFEGILRGLIHDKLLVPKGLKIGDLDPRMDPRICRLVSDKALAVGGGVLEVILSAPSLRTKLWK